MEQFKKGDKVVCTKSATRYFVEGDKYKVVGVEAGRVLLTNSCGGTTYPDVSEFELVDPYEMPMNGKEAIKAMLDGEKITWGNGNTYLCVLEEGLCRFDAKAEPVDLMSINFNWILSCKSGFSIYKKPEHEFKPFEEVLVRDEDYQDWEAKHFGRVCETKFYRYRTMSGTYSQCIPYKGNEHLLGTADNV